MLTADRWEVECGIMRQLFPWLTPFETRSGCVGFFGKLRGPKKGRTFEIVLKVPANLYPETEPPVYLYPRIGSNWRPDGVNQNAEGKLCYDRPGYKGWNPARSSFANCVFVALDYLKVQGE